jgi:hypothetical protein
MFYRKELYVYKTQYDFFYRQEKNRKEKVEQKSKEYKDVLQTTPRRRKCINDATNVTAENNSGDDDVQIDNASGDVQSYIVHGDVQRKDDLFTKSLKEIINNHDIKGKSSLEIINLFKIKSHVRTNIYAKKYATSEDATTRWASELGTRCRAHLDITK